MRKGIFWCKNHNTEQEELIIVSVACDADGKTSDKTVFSSKSGENYNHKAEWEHIDKSITEGHPYNYYPRGRVEIKNGKIIIFLNPDINKPSIIKEIAETFELDSDQALNRIKIKSDGSNHYQYRCTV